MIALLQQALIQRRAFRVAAGVRSEEVEILPLDEQLALSHQSTRGDWLAAQARTNSNASGTTSPRSAARSG